MKDQQGGNSLLDNHQQKGSYEGHHWATIGQGQGSSPIGQGSVREEAVIGQMATVYFLIVEVE